MKSIYHVRFFSHIVQPYLTTSCLKEKPQLIKANDCFPSVSRLEVESHDQPGEAALLRGAGSPQQAAPGEIPGLQVQAAAQTHLPGGRQEAAHRRVQGHHEVPQAGDETILQRRVRDWVVLGPGGFCLFYK